MGIFDLSVKISIERDLTERIDLVKELEDAQLHYSQKAYLDAKLRKTISKLEDLE